MAKVSLQSLTNIDGFMAAAWLWQHWVPGLTWSWQQLVIPKWYVPSAK